LDFCSQIGIVSGHILASAKPSLLFPLSHKNLQKKPLDDVSLIKRWLQILDSSCGNGFFYLPGGEDLPFVKCAPSNWKFGYSYNKNAISSSCIPVFPDDPKAEHLKSVGPNCKVDVFFSSISARPEFTNRLGAFLEIKIDEGNGKENVVVEETNTDVVSKDEWNEIYDCLMNKTDFSSIEEAIKCSAVLLGRVKNLKVIDANGRMTLKDSVVDKRKPERRDIQSLVQKKAKN
jgi:uncharacterized protein YfkK (UPF0435 family)